MRLARLRAHFRFREQSFDPRSQDSHGPNQENIGKRENKTEKVGKCFAANSGACKETECAGDHDP
jgi:hypothetical protein